MKKLISLLMEFCMLLTLGSLVACNASFVEAEVDVDGVAMNELPRFKLPLPA